MVGLIASQKVIISFSVESTKLLERIATAVENPVRPDQPKDANSQLLGAYQGFLDWLTECIDTPNALEKAKKLRDLQTRVNQLRDFYYGEVEKENPRQIT